MSAERMRYYVLLLDEPEATGFLAPEGEGDMVSISAYMYFYGADAPERGPGMARRVDEQLATA